MHNHSSSNVTAGYGMPYTGNPPSGGAPATDEGTTTNPTTQAGAIAGGVVGGVAAVTLIPVAIWFFRRRRRTKAGQFQEISELPGNTRLAQHRKTFVPPVELYAHEPVELPNNPPPVEMYSGPKSPGIFQHHLTQI